MDIQLSIGIISPPLKEQLEALKIRFIEEDIEIIQRDIDALSRLSARGLITPSVSKKISDKIFKEIEISLKNSN